MSRFPLAWNVRVKSFHFTYPLSYFIFFLRFSVQYVTDVCLQKLIHETVLYELRIKFSLSEIKRFNLLHVYEIEVALISSIFTG